MTHKAGEIIGKYTVSRDFTTANAGQCLWGFASYGDEEFFIKKFLSPVYPQKDAPGSEKSKQKRRKKCEEFEAKHQAIKKALSDCGEGGLVVKTVDFFKDGNHYYKVCQKVDTSSLSSTIHLLEPKEKLFSMLTASFALKLLHSNKIIHLDLKPDNILIQNYGGKQVSKIIDFDDSIIGGDIISPEHLVGDLVYYSPELGQYIESDGETSPPSYQSDIFSLGLVFHEYWTGKFPSFNEKYAYAYEALINSENLLLNVEKHEDKKSDDVKGSRIKTRLLGKKIEESSTFSEKESFIEQEIRQLISNMLQVEPKKRPSSKDVHSQLKNIRDGKKTIKDESSEETKVISSSTSTKDKKPRIKMNFKTK